MSINISWLTRIFLDISPASLNSSKMSQFSRTKCRMVAVALQKSSINVFHLRIVVVRETLLAKGLWVISRKVTLFHSVAVNL